MSSLCVNFWRSYSSLWTKNIGNTQFSALFSYMLWHIELKFSTGLCFDVPQSKFMCLPFALIYEGAMPLCDVSTFAVLRYIWKFSDDIGTFVKGLSQIPSSYCTYMTRNELLWNFKNDNTITHITLNNLHKIYVTSRLKIFDFEKQAILFLRTTLLKPIKSLVTWNSFFFEIFIFCETSFENMLKSIWH